MAEVILATQTPPAAPSAGNVGVYADSSDGYLRQIDSAGNVTRCVSGLPLALTGATVAARFVGGTASGAPVSGTFQVGDFVVTQGGTVFVCTVAGSPGTWVQAGGAGGATVATTVAGLGTASDGKLGLIRAGSSPYEMVQLIYDATYAHWVSHPYPTTNDNLNGATTTNTAYVLVSSNGLQRVWLPWAVLNTAGLTWQFRLTGQVTATAGNTTSAALQVFSGNIGSTAANQGANFATISTTSTTTNVQDSGWVSLPGGLTVQDQLTVDLFIKVSAGTAAGISSGSISARLIG